MKRTWMWALAAVVLAGGGIAWRLAGDEAPAASYLTAEVSRGPIVAKVTATGTLSALVTVQVGSQVSGRIQELLVDFNSPVKKGQLIARIDPLLFKAAAEQARANYQAAQANVSKARVQALEAQRQFERQKALASQNLVAQADLDAAEATARAAEASVEAAEAALAQARAAYNQAKVNLAYTEIFSPIDGVVISRDVDVGQTVAAALQAPTLFTIAEDLTRMQVDTNVAEADIGRLEPGMEATFTVDAFPQMSFSGRIRQIRNAPITVQNVVTYDAVIDVSNPDLKLKPGMTANVTIVVAEAKDALRVPNAALRFRPPELEGGPGANRRNGDRVPPGKRRLFVLRDGKPFPLIITAGITDGTFTQVLEGDLKEGDRVITEMAGSGAPRFTPGLGQPVRGVPRRAF